MQHCHGLRQRCGAQVAQLVLLDSDFSCLPDVVMEGRRVINNITRTASMYLIKTVFSFLLSVITVFTPFNYPFTPIQLTLISMFCVGIPTFFLALEPSRDRITGNFLSTVLQRSLPGALIVVLYVMLIQSLGPALGFTEAQSSTLSVYLTALPTLRCFGASAAAQRHARHALSVDDGRLLCRRAPVPRLIGLRHEWHDVAGLPCVRLLLPALDAAHRKSVEKMAAFA